MKARGNPDRNPSNWAELSTQSRNLRGQFMAIMSTRVTSSAH